MFLPYGRQTIDEDDVAAVAEALRADFLTTGPEVAAFERELAALTGARHVTVCNSGTAALHLAMLALRIGPGDVVVVPTVTFLATANVVRMCGAEVVFADVDPDTGLVTPEAMNHAVATGRLRGKVRAAFAIHLNGQLCDLEALATLLEHQGIALVEDAAHCIGADYRWDTASPSRLACFSTHPVKTIATGEGGFVVSNNPGLAQAIERYRSHGMIRESAAFQLTDLAFDGAEPNPWHYEMDEVGWNYRLPDVLCALGRSQLRKLPRFMQRRRALAARYDKLLGVLGPHIRPVPRGGRPDGLHLYPVLVNFPALGTTRRCFMQRLREQGIGSQVHYIPVHLQPYYKRSAPTPALPGAMTYFSRCLSIPFYAGLSDSDQDRVVAAVREAVGLPR